MSVGENIKRIRLLNDMTQEDFGKIAKVSSMAVSQWENDRAVPRMGAIQCIADYFKIPKSEIVDDDSRSRFMPGAIIPQPSPPAYAPLLGRIHAGAAQEPEILEEHVQLPADVSSAHPRAYFLEVEGDCMDKVYPDGCYILVDPDKAPQNGSIAAIAIDGHDAVMRRLLRTASTMVLSSESFNPEHEDVIITADSEHTIELIGTVVWFQASKEME